MSNPLPDKERKAILKDVLNTLGAAWPKKELTEDEVRVWYAQIGHLDRETAERACSMVISECEWYPTIAKYLECARSILRSQEAKLAQAPVLLTDAARKIQEQALAAQREISARRSMRNSDSAGMANGHNHSNGWASCEICVQAATESASADECSTCMLIEDCGLHPSHPST